MRIGIDIDNTISNTREVILDYIRRFDQENGLKTEVDLSQYSLEKSLMWDTELIKRFLDTYLSDIYKWVRPKPNAPDVIRDLYRHHSIILITSRNQRDNSITEVTLEWLSRYQIAYHKLVMNETENMHHFSKLAACMENNIDVMIEDHHDLSLELSDKIPVLMFDYPYNAFLKANNIFRVKDWLEVKAFFDAMPPSKP